VDVQIILKRIASFGEFSDTELKKINNPACVGTKSLITGFG